MYIVVNVGRDSSVGIATPGWTVWGSLPGGARFSAPVQTGPGPHPASYAVSTRSFPMVKQPGRDVDHPPQSSVEVKDRVKVYLYSSPGP